MAMKLGHVYNHAKKAIQLRIPFMLWGPPGIGKSAIVHQICNELGFVNYNNGEPNVIDLRLAQLEPTDLRGVPMPNHDTMRADWFLPAFWPERAKEDGETVYTDADGKKHVLQYKAGECPYGPGVVFLDEIEKAPISVKNASLQLVLDRSIGSYMLPDNWAMACAGNREEDNCFSQPLGTALANRMLHFDVSTDIETWAAWARNHSVSEEIISFLYWKSELLYISPKNTENAFPTPRSWETASRIMAIASNKKEQKELMASAVGTGAATEFVAYRDVYRAVDPEEVFKGNMPNLKSEEQSVRYAIALAVAFRLRKRKKGMDGVEKHLANFLKILPTELRVIFLRQQTLQMLEKMMKHKEFADLAKEMMKIVV